MLYQRNSARLWISLSNQKDGSYEQTTRQDKTAPRKKIKGYMRQMW